MRVLAPFFYVYEETVIVIEKHDSEKTFAIIGIVSVVVLGVYHQYIRKNIRELVHNLINKVK